eukprot:1022201-Alexandrium_andersonii.AAC.1
MTTGVVLKVPRGLRGGSNGVPRGSEGVQGGSEAFRSWNCEVVQKRSQHRFPKLPRGPFCALFPP